jgi:hypothetical protein
MRTEKLYARIASLVQAIENCQRSGNTEWERRHEEVVDHLVKNFMPSGSGVDPGTSFNLKGSTPEKLVFATSFHHMNEHGYYDGWTSHGVTVRPSLAFGIMIHIAGPNRNDIKDYLHDVFDGALRAEIEDAKAYPGERANVA